MRNRWRTILLASALATIPVTPAFASAVVPSDVRSAATSAPNPLEARADAADVVRALAQRDLPGTLTPALRSQADRILSDLRAHRNKQAVFAFRSFARSSGRISQEHVAQVAEYAWREGVLATIPELADAADRLRFQTERHAATLRTLNQLRAFATDPGLAIAPVDFASKTDYARGTRGDVTQEKWVRRDALAAHIEDYEKQLTEVDARSDEARNALDAAAAKAPHALRILGELSKIARTTRPAAPAKAAPRKANRALAGTPSNPGTRS